MKNIHEENAKEGIRVEKVKKEGRRETRRRRKERGGG